MNANEYLKLAEIIKSENVTIGDLIRWGEANPPKHPSRVNKIKYSDLLRVLESNLKIEYVRN